MAGVRERGRLIRDDIIARVRFHPTDIGQVCAARFGISRQAVNKHLHRLVADGILVAHGTTRSRRYSLAELARKKIFIQLKDNPDEDRVWRTEIQPLLSELPPNTRQVWQYGFTGMMNNAIDHSSGNWVCIVVAQTTANVRITLNDDGEGIFRKITRELELDDERHAVLELAKGKLTTDPKNHTGEGIFFTSRLFDRFAILSHEVYFSHESDTDEDWILEAEARSAESSGTYVALELNNSAAKTPSQVFEEYTDDATLAFSKTVVPVRLVRYGDEALISRSQAKRLLTRFDRFKTVILDFDGVEQIGQGFADEVFRVFVRAHPGIEILPVKANSHVDAMIRRARAVA